MPASLDLTSDRVCSCFGTNLRAGRRVTGLRLIRVGGHAVSSRCGSVARFKPLVVRRCVVSPAEPVALNHSLPGKSTNGAGQAEQEPIGNREEALGHPGEMPASHHVWPTA
jgi:hypothetical protein